MPVLYLRHYNYLQVTAIIDFLVKEDDLGGISTLRVRRSTMRGVEGLFGKLHQGSKRNAEHKSSHGIKRKSKEEGEKPEKRARSLAQAQLPLSLSLAIALRKKARSLRSTRGLWRKHRSALSTPKKQKKDKNTAKRSEPEDVSTSGSESEYLDPEKGIAILKWHKGMPDELEMQESADRVTIERLCSHTTTTFWKAVEEAFDLPTHMHRRVHLGPKDGSTLHEAQVLANKGHGNKQVLFYLETEPAAILEEARSAPESTIPTHEGDSVREAAYREMVDEAVGAKADQFNMSVRIWKYNLMLAEGDDGARVDLRNITLDLQGRQGHEGQANGAAIEAIQYTHDTKSLNQELSDQGVNGSEDAGSSLPLSMIKEITPEEIACYHERNKWIDNPDYQPQDHTQACQNLRIPNPDQPRIEGLLPSLSFDKHQPTAISALVEFENSCVGAALNAEEVGLGKTVEMIGLLLFRSNQRKEAIVRGENVSKALPTLIVLPQNLVEQWRDEIFQFTDRFTICMYYGPSRKSGNEKVLYVPKTQTKGRFTRSHKFFSGAEENSDVIVLTSYATWTVRHGPEVQWDWLCEQRRSQSTDAKKPTKTQTENALMKEVVAYHSIHTECPHQLHGLFERIILDEGRYQEGRSTREGHSVQEAQSAQELVR